MRVFIAVLVLIFGLQSWTKADDIMELEIEGMSIGDSLLDHFNDKQIRGFYKINYPDKKYIFANFISEEKEYSHLQVGYKNGDANYIIELLNGVITFKQEIEKCYKKLEEIKEFVMSNIEYSKKSGPLVREFLPADAPNKAKLKQYKFTLSVGSILLYCVDHPLGNNKQDKLKLQMQTNDMSAYLRSQ